MDQAQYDRAQGIIARVLTPEFEKELRLQWTLGHLMRMASAQAAQGLVAQNMPIAAEEEEGQHIPERQARELIHGKLWD